MSEEIQEAVEKFLNKNGNKKYTNNQLIIYALEKIDRLPCLKHMTIIEDLEREIEHKEQEIARLQAEIDILKDDLKEIKKL